MNPHRTIRWLVVSALLLAACGAAHAAEHLGDLLRAEYPLSQKLRCRSSRPWSRLGFDVRIHHPVVLFADFKTLRQGKFIRLRQFGRVLKDEMGKPVPQPAALYRLEQEFPIDTPNVNAQNEVRFYGSFPTGLGEYEFALMIDNGAGAGCIHRWTSKAWLPEKTLKEEITLAPGEIANTQKLLFAPQESTEKDGTGLRACILLNMDAAARGRAVPDFGAAEIATSAIRRLATDSRVAEVSLFAFSLEDQNLGFFQGYSEQVGFSEIGEAYNRLDPARVDVRQIGTNTELAFLRRVLWQASGCMAKSDITVLVGPEWVDQRGDDALILESLAPGKGRLLVYLRTSQPDYSRRDRFRATTWNLDDAISRAVDQAGGKRLFPRTPRDLVNGLRDALTEAAEIRRARTSATASAQ